MTFAFAPNIVLLPNTDRIGQLILALRDALVGSGLWVVTGSSDGTTYENEGQTAGPVWDVITAAQPYRLAPADSGGGAGSISNVYAWIQIKEAGTARTHQFQRGTASNNGYMIWRFCPGGVATSGANATTVPAPVGASVNVVGNMSTRGTGSFSSANVFDYNASQEGRLSIGYSTSARGGGVCPWFFVNSNMVTNLFGSPAFYESLVDTVPGNTEPWILSANAAWITAVGGVGDTSSGPFNNASNRWNGTNLAGWTFDRINSSAMGATYPGAQYAPIMADGTWRAEYCRVRTATLGYLGRSEHFIVNQVARDFPATYNLSTPDAKITMGHLILPWAQGVVPDWGP